MPHNIKNLEWIRSGSEILQTADTSIGQYVVYLHKSENDDKYVTLGPDDSKSLYEGLSYREAIVAAQISFVESVRECLN